jgi:hypothetical protein
LVGNYGRNFWRAKTMNNIEPFAYGKVENLFRNEPINANFLRRGLSPASGRSATSPTSDESLNYNAMQVSVNRRLDHGSRWASPTRCRRPKACRDGMP